MQMSQEIRIRMMKKINPRTSTAAIALLLGGGMVIMASSEVVGQQQQPTSLITSFSVNQTLEEWTASFDLESCDLVSTGENSYFILEPGYQVILEGEEDGEELQLTMTVLDETKVVDGVETRVVEEKESERGNLVEVSRNYFAICKPTNDAFYFGEDVDIYEDGEIVSHEGAWLAGQNGAKAGMIMPGSVKVGMKYYQEIAPGVAEDRAEIVSVNEVLDTPAGNFQNVLKTEETNPLEPNEKEYKFYAPGIGLVQEEGLKLVNYTQP
jgi:predicted lipase